MNVHDRWMQWMNAGLSVKSLSVSLVFCAAVAEGVKSQRRSIHPLWFIESPWYASHLTQFITTKSSMWSTSGSENRHIKMQFEISPVPNFLRQGRRRAFSLELHINAISQSCVLHRYRRFLHVTAFREKPAQSSLSYCVWSQGYRAIGLSDRSTLKISLKWNPIPFLLHKPLCVWEIGSQRVLTRIACHLNWPCVSHVNAAHTEPCSGHSYLNCISVQLGINVRCIELGGCSIEMPFRRNPQSFLSQCVWSQGSRASVLVLPHRNAAQVEPYFSISKLLCIW